MKMADIKVRKVRTTGLLPGDRFHQLVNPSGQEGDVDSVRLVEIDARTAGLITYQGRDYPVWFVTGAVIREGVRVQGVRFTALGDSHWTVQRTIGTDRPLETALQMV